MTWIGGGGRAGGQAGGSRRAEEFSWVKVVSICCPYPIAGQGEARLLSVHCALCQRPCCSQQPRSSEREKTSGR